MSSKGLGLGKLWDKLVRRYPKLWIVEQIFGYAVWAFILFIVITLAWKGYHGTL